MKKAFGVLSVVLAVCCALVLGPSPAKAECTTQGALALGLAEMLKLNVVTADAAAAALAALGIEPQSGWKPAECLTPDIAAQVQAAYAEAIAGGRSASLTPGAVEAVLDALRPADRKYDVISPITPP